MERGNNSYGQETVMAKNWDKIGVLGCNSVIPRNVGEPPTGDGTAVGNAASAAAADSLAVGDGAAAHGQKSVAIGSGSIANNDNECSVGEPATESAAEVTREVTHVSEPTAPSSAATKGYVDGSINVIAPKTVENKPVSGNALCVAIGEGAVTEVEAGRQFGPVAIGTKSKSTGMHSVTIGAESVASGTNSVSVGPQASANAAGSSAIGPAAHSHGTYSVAEGIAANSIDANSVAIGGYSQSIKPAATAVGTYAGAVGNYSVAIGGTCSTCSSRCVAIGMNSSVVGSKVPDPNVLEFEPNGTDSVALGSFSVADDYRTVSVGNDVESIDHYYRAIDSSGKPTTVAPFWVKKTVALPARYQHIKRRIIHVADPIDGHNAATKNYVDANTSNAFTGTAHGKTLHVEDAWPSKPLRLSFIGACKQDGTPSPESPVPIEVVENPVLRVTGEDTSAAGASLPITLPSEHPYLAALPNHKTADAIFIEKDGTATLRAMVGKSTTAASDGISATVGTDALSSTGAIADGAVVYYKLAESVTYQLGKLEVPALPETVSNVWVEAALAPEEMLMVYKQDANATVLHSSSSITIENGTAKVNPSIFGNGLSVATTGKVSVNMTTVAKNIAGNNLLATNGKLNVNLSILAGDWISVANGHLNVNLSKLTGDGLTHDAMGLKVNTGQGLCIRNGRVDIEQDSMPLAGKTKRGTVRVGDGLSIDNDGVLSTTSSTVRYLTVETNESSMGVSESAPDFATQDTSGCVAKNPANIWVITKLSFSRKLSKAYAAGTSLSLSFIVKDNQDRKMDTMPYQFAVVKMGANAAIGIVGKRLVNGTNSSIITVPVAADMAEGEWVYVSLI